MNDGFGVNSSDFGKSWQGREIYSIRNSSAAKFALNEDIKLNHKSRDDIPALLIELQYLYSQEALRDRLFALMDKFHSSRHLQKGGTSGHGDV